MKAWLPVILLFAFVVAGCGEDPVSEPAAGEAGLERALDERLAAAAAAGASGVLRIVHDGQLLYESGFGSATCAGDTPVTPEHVFMIGSITKEMTQVLGYVLEEQGFLSHDETVAVHLPAVTGPIGGITLRQLLDHTGALPDLIDANGQPVPYTVEYDYEPVSRDALIERAALAELIGEPGVEEAYSNLGYQLLAAIYEVATGKTYPEILHQYIFEPAGMRDTAFWFDDADNRRFADGCRSGNERWGNPVTDAMWGPAGPSWNLVGAGGLLSTAESLNRFFEAVSDGSLFDDPAAAERYRNDRYSFSERRQQLVMGSAGSNGIFNAVAIWGDRDRFSLVLMTNRADHQGETELLRDILGLIPPEYFARQ